MTENVETTETAPKTARELRHAIRDQAVKIVFLTQGQQMDKEHQVRRVAKVTRAIGIMLALTTELATLVNERDFDAHQAEKQAEKEKVMADFTAMTENLIVMDDDEDDSSLFGE
jgi:hypothetical protein